MNTELAKAYLIRILTDPLLHKKLPAAEIIKTGKKVHGLTRGELKTARKELGIISENEAGTQVWYLPCAK